MANDVKDTSIRVAIMGVTGTGKSSFVQTASQLSDIGVGHSLHSYTADVKAYDFVWEGQPITLIDTPGFNDTTRTEREVLQSIADFFDYELRNPPFKKLTGIIYLQSITDPRLYGSSLRNLNMFRNLVGEDPLRNVILATTKWGLAKKSGEADLAIEREKELIEGDNFWAPMIQRGSHVSRFEDTRESAIELILSLADRRPRVLQIQTELVYENKALIDTQAGNAVNEEMKRLEQKYKAELEQINKEKAEAIAQHDHDLREALEQERSRFERRLDDLREEQSMLAYERRNESRRMQREIDRLGASLAVAEKDREDISTVQARFTEKYEQKLNSQQLDFDETVKKLRESENKLREEQRIFLEKKINDMSKKDGWKRTGTNLLLSLLPSLGSVVFNLIGMTL